MKWFYLSLSFVELLSGLFIFFKPVVTISAIDDTLSSGLLFTEYVVGVFSLFLDLFQIHSWYIVQHELDEHIQQKVCHSKSLV
jgi:hypothetical protein